MKRFILSVFIGSFFINISVAQKKNLELTDIFDLEYVSNPQISPDGEKIIYVRNFTDIMTDKNLSNLWIINSDGSHNRPLTTGNQNDFSPRWSHDGSKIVFRSNQQDDKVKLYLMWMDSGDVFALTNTAQTPGSVSWSYNDNQLAFSMFVPKDSPSIVKLPAKPEGAKWNAPPVFIDKMDYRADGEGFLKSGNNQIFVISTDGGTPRQLTTSAYDHGTPEWNFNDKSLIFSANLHKNHDLEPLDSEIYQLNIEDTLVQALTSRKGPDSNPKISPDGKMIAYTGFDDRYQGYQTSKIYLMNADGSGSRLLTQNFERNPGNIMWDGDSKGLFFQYDDHGETKIAHISLDGKVKSIAGNLGGLDLGRPYTAAEFSVSNKGTLAYTLGGTSHPADLGVSKNGKTQRLTNLNEDVFSYRELASVEEISWKSSFDQREIQGWLVKPANFDPNKKYPFILEIHGGPFASYGAVFSAEIQLYAAAGYVVLYSNPRGSTGYGEEFGNLIHHDYPNHDYDDLMSGVDVVLEKGFVNKDQLFVTGGSGGGVLTAWIVGKTDRFKAAVVAKPVINWYSFVLYADGPGFFYKYWFPNKPWEDPSSYIKRSPISYVANIHTPTMLLVGEEDHRTPVAESEQFYAALKLEGVETAMVRIPGASHHITARPSNMVAKVASILAWFNKYKGE